MDRDNSYVHYVLDDTFVDAQLIMDLSANDVQMPFYLFDEVGIRAAQTTLKQAFSWCAGYRQYFPAKANSNPTILRIMREEGSGVVCSSEIELQLAKYAGFTGEEIIFEPVVPSKSEIRMAKELKAQVILDGEELIPLFQQEQALPEIVGLRLHPGMCFRINHCGIQSGNKSKLGMDRDALLRAAKQLKKCGITTIGLHMQAVKNSTDPRYLPAVAKILFQLAVDIKEQYKLQIAFCDLGGGLGFPSKSGSAALNISEIGQSIQELYDEIMRPADLVDVPIHTQLGRFVLDPHGILVAKVLHIKHGLRDFIGLDASVCDLPKTMIYHTYHHISILKKDNMRGRITCDIVGPISDSGDKFGEMRIIGRAVPGDLCIIHHCGAYGRSMGMNYNGRLRAGEYLYCLDGSVQKIRRKETVEDYFATLDCNPELKQGK